MVRIDIDDLYDPLLVARNVSFVGSECSGLTLDTASVTSITTEEYGYVTVTTPTGNKNVVFGNNTNHGDVSTASRSNNNRYTKSLLPSICTRIIRRPTIVIPRQCCLMNTPENVIVEELDESHAVAPTCTTTTSRLELHNNWTDDNEDPILHDEVIDSASTMSHWVKNWNTGNYMVIPFGSTIMSPIEQRKRRYDNDTMDVVPSSPLPLLDDRNCYNTSCRRATASGMRLSKASLRLLELPRDIEFDASYDSSSIDGDDDLDMVVDGI